MPLVGNSTRRIIQKCEFSAVLVLKRACPLKAHKTSILMRDTADEIMVCLLTVVNYPYFRSLVLSLALFALSGYFNSESQAAIYKWIDDNGKVHYSDQPPPASQAEEIDVDTAPSAPTNGLTDEQRQQKQQRLLDAFTKERADKKATEEKATKAAEERKSWCVRARDELRQLKEATYLYDYDESGEMIIYSKEAREQVAREQAARIDKYC